jgi:ferredoxin
MPKVSIFGTDKSFEIEENSILFDSLSDMGEELPHGCLSGSCGACRIEVIEGHQNLIPPGAVEENTIDAIKDELTATMGAELVQSKTIRLSCRAKVIGDVTFSPIK